MTALRPLVIALSCAMIVALVPARADAQCRRVCEKGEKRDGQGCCIAKKKGRVRGPRIDKVTKQAFARLPADMMLVGAVNVAAIRKTEMYKDLVQTLESNSDFKKGLKEMQANWGVDYRKHIDHVWLGVPSALDSKDPVLVLVKGTWKQRTIINWMRKEWGSSYQVQTVGLGTYFEGKGIAIAFMGKGYMLISTPTLTRKAVAAWKGKEKSALQAKGDLMRATQNAKTRAHIWAAFVMPSSLAQAVERQVAPASNLVWASIDASFARGLKVNTTGFMTAKKHASSFLTILEQVKKELAKNPDVDKAGMTSLVDAIKLSSKGAELKLKVSLSAYQVGKIFDGLLDEIRKKN